MTRKSTASNKSNNSIEPATDQSPGAVSSDATPPAEDWHTLSRTASEFGVSVTWLESFCVKHQLTVRQVKNPHYSSASPMRLIELNAVKRYFATEPDALIDAQKRSKRARRASATAATREKQKALEAQRRLGEVTQLVESLGPLEASLFWFGQMTYSENQRQFIVGASWELLGGLLASGGTLSRTEENALWQFPSGLEVRMPCQLLKNWRWISLLSRADHSAASENSESTVTIRRPFGRMETVKTFDASIVHHNFLKSFADWTNRTSVIPTRAYSIRSDEQMDRELGQLFAYSGNEIWERFHITTHDAEIWKRHQFSAQRALAYIACGIGVGEARSFAEVGLDILKGPDLIVRWRDDLYRLKEWQAYGLDVRSASLWTDAGFSPDDGAQWSRLDVPPDSAAILRMPGGYHIRPPQYAELLASLERVHELGKRRKEVSDHVRVLLSRKQTFDDVKFILLNLHANGSLDRRHLRMISHLLHEQMPISIAFNLMMQLPAEAGANAEHILRSAAWLWENRPNMGSRALIDWASCGIKVETALQLIDFGVSVQQAKQYRALFNRSPKTTKNVLSRIANGEALGDIAETYRSTKKKKKAQEARRIIWAEFFRVNAQLIPPGFGPFDREVVKSFQTGRAPVPEYILKRWGETNQLPRWARSLGLGH